MPYTVKELRAALAGCHPDARVLIHDNGIELALEIDWVQEGRRVYPYVELHIENPVEASRSSKYVVLTGSETATS